MAQFERFRDREIVRNAATTLTDTRISIREHFPFEIEERRKKLYPAMGKALKRDSKVRMVRDKIYINDALYDEADQKVANLRPQQNKNETRRNLDSPWNRQHVRPISNNRPSDRKFGQNTQYDSSESTTKAYDMDSRKFVRAGRVRLNPSNFTNVDFTTPNSYQVIDSTENEETQSQTRNKKKLTSPFEERENKIVHLVKKPESLK